MQGLCVTLFLAVLGIANGIPVDYDSDFVRSFGSGSFWNTDNYPNPRTDFSRCHQSKPSTICDPDQLLTTAESTQLTDLAQRLHNTSPCLCKDECTEEAHKKGLVVGVALTKTIYHSSHVNKNVAAYNFSKEIMKNWNLGVCGNEILIMFATDLKAGSIETGNAVKEFIPQETIEEIFEQCKDYFTEAAYYQGLESIINSLYDSIQSKMLKAPTNEEANTNKGSVGITVGLVVGIACLAGFVAVGFFVIRRRNRNSSNQNGFMYDGSSGRQAGRNIKRDMIGPIVKNPVVFPDAVYQPCSVDDGKKSNNTKQQAGSDDEDDVDNNEDQYLRKLEENPAYDLADLVHDVRTLGVVQENPEHEPITPGVTVNQINDLNKLPSSKIENSNVDYA